jgi:hypothetical protein
MPRSLGVDKLNYSESLPRDVIDDTSSTATKSFYHLIHHSQDERLIDQSLLMPNMWPPVPLPYFRGSGSLPGPLPTKEDIETSTIILRHDPDYHRIVVVGEHYLVKYGRGVERREGDTLRFIEHNLKIPAPRLYAMYREQSSGWLYIIMEFLPGETLEGKWSALLEQEKTLITSKLRRIFDKMRHLPSPDFYGDISQRHLPHHLFWIKEKVASISGPFDNEHDLNMSFVGRLRAIAEENGMHSYKADFYERSLSRALSNHPPTFSHSDVQRKNILVREIPAKSPGQEKDYELSIIDWEEAGWYPSYWEYAAVAIAFQWDDDWPARLEEFIDPWPSETAMLKILYQEIFF